MGAERGGDRLSGLEDDGASTRPFSAPREPSRAFPFAPGSSREVAELSPEDVHSDEPDIGGETVMLGASSQPSAARPVLPFAAGAGNAARPPWVRPGNPLEMSPSPAASTSSPWAAASLAQPAPVRSPEPLPPLPAFGASTPPGVIAASNAAAHQAQAERPREVQPAVPRAVPLVRGSSREVLRLLFVDPASLDRVRRHESWRVILAELELRLLESGREDERGRAEVSKEKRDVFEVLSRGEATPLDRLRDVFSGAVDEQGKFEPPLVLLSGELELPFEEISVLKATVAATRPIAGGDKRLGEVLDAVEELAKTPWLEGSSGVSESLLARVREAFAGARRAVGWEQVEAHTERMLLERRCYQTRSLWGKAWLRGLMRGGGGGEVPVYLPEGLRQELPLFKRMRVKMIGELEGREDQYEASVVAVKMVGLARVLLGVG